MRRMNRTFVIVMVLLGAVLLGACGEPVPPLATSTPAPTPTSPPPTQTSAPTPMPESTATVTPTETPAPSPVLPAPLYFLNNEEQIARLKTDGIMLTQITDEPGGITDFDVSVAGDALAYVASNYLIRADASGANPLVLIQGPAEPDESGQTTRLHSPRFSPDGTQIAFAMDGVQVISTDGGEVRSIKPDDPPGAGAGRYAPAAWSPDGWQLLINYAFYTHGGQLLVKNLDDGSEAHVGLSCCHPSWSPDGKYVYVSGPFYGPDGRPGLRRYDVETGTVSALIEDDAADNRLPLVAYARQLSDGQLYMFANTVTQAEYTEAAGAVDFTMYRAAPDDLDSRVALREDGYKLRDVLWAADASGAVIADAGAGQNGEFPLRWLPTDGGPAVELAATWSAEPRTRLAWGPASAATPACEHEYFFYAPTLEGCPVEPPTEAWAAEQVFEGGRMIWLEPQRQIYALYDDGTWVSFADTWTPDQPEKDPDIEPPEGRHQPIRGFGKVWRNQPEIRERLGWALAPERGFDTAFQHGRTASRQSPDYDLYLQNGDGRVVHLDARDMRWEYVTP